MYEPAVEYYTSHSKRVRRKRNRHAQSGSGYPTPLGPTNVVRPLRPEGWTVRYEYKMACFAEFRGEDEVALKFVFFLSTFRILNEITDTTKMPTLPLSLCLARLPCFLQGPKGGQRQKYWPIALISKYVTCRLFQNKHSTFLSRFANCISTTMSMPWHSRSTTLICGSTATSLGSGESTRRLSSSGAGSLDSKSD